MIYFIRQKGTESPVKVGFTNSDYRIRLSDLQIGCPNKLEVFRVIDGGKEEEKAAHVKLDAHKYRGEWFNMCDDLHELMHSKPCIMPRKLEAMPKPSAAIRIGMVMNNGELGFCQAYRAFVFGVSLTGEKIVMRKDRGVPMPEMDLERGRTV